MKHRPRDNFELVVRVRLSDQNPLILKSAFRFLDRISKSEIKDGKEKAESGVSPHF